MAEHYFSRRPTSREDLGLVRCRLRGLDFEFLTSSGVFSYRRIDSGSRLLIESMVLPEGGRVLDVGCGYGPVGIAAARLSPGLEVWMTDVNERAVSLALRNAGLNGVGSVRVLQGDLYEPVGGLVFDAVLSNPPISAGMRRVVGPLVEGAWDRLVEGGSLQLVVQWNKGGRTVASMMGSRFGGHDVLARRGGSRVLRSVKKGDSEAGS
ncbi:MAG: class I SAM-dependent methyltransferase [Candidatus Bathyarchaeota archaeon]|nr:MAG: class I SAM-dependent methyltransferase [Candidatus Bathyarchaeota archaeon]